LIQLPGIQDPERAKEIIGKTAFWNSSSSTTQPMLRMRSKTARPWATTALRSCGRGEGAGTEKQAYVVESRPLMTGEYVQDARVRPAQQLQGASVS
jgi:preprotein translocase subunit SecD